MSGRIFTAAYSAETILATRQHFADLCLACIAGAQAGKATGSAS